MKAANKADRRSTENCSGILRVLVIYIVMNGI